MKKETVGKIATDLQLKADQPVSAIEQMRESLTDYEKNVWECVDKHRKEFPGDFYVIVLTKNERLLTNVIRNYFFARNSCPTPNYDQTVYKYKRADDELVFMWTLPARDVCHHLVANALQVDDTERELLKFVMAFRDGTLFTLAKELNGEISLDSPIVES